MMQDSQLTMTVGDPYESSTATSIDGPDQARLQDLNEHLLQGIAYRERGEYVKAIDEFLGACQLSSRLDLDWGECDDNLERMLFVLDYFFEPDGDHDFRFWEGEPLPEAALKELASRTSIPPGHLVTGGRYVFASYPLNEEGREAAIEYARRLAHEDWQARYKYPGTTLGDVPDFEMIVYKHEKRPEVIFRVPSS